MVTPLLRTPNKNGGTLYTFPSASRDLTRAITNDDYEFKFSHFACLNMPYIYENAGDGLYLDGFNGGKVGGSKSSNDLNIALVEHLQNYVMNFETLILNGGGDNDDYNFDILRSVSERVFFNWLKTVGGISFDYQSGGYVYEQDKYSDSYDAAKRTVPYIGNIDIINSVELNGDAYNEVYLHIPSGDGATSDIHFRKISDDNYIAYHEYKTTLTNIIGREIDNASDSVENGKTANGLSVDAIYDVVGSTTNKYISDAGYCIDFDETHYVDDIVTMNANSGDSFEFNAILIYYDFTYGGETVTNLYGILFLEEVSDTSGLNNSVENPMGGIQKYPKIKESALRNGNSFAFKVDIKIDTMPYTTYGENYLIPYDEMNTNDEMNMFVKVMDRVQEAIDTFYTQQKTIMALNDRLSKVEGLLNNVDSLSLMSSKIQAISDRLNSYSIGDEDVIKSMLNENTKILNSIVGGKLPAEFQYNTDVISPSGYGVSVVKSDDGKTIEINSNPNYNVRAVRDDMDADVNSENPIEVSVYNKEDASDCYITLGECANLAVIYMDDSSCRNNLEIYVDDTACGWKIGQTMRIYFRSDDGDGVAIGDDAVIRIHTGKESDVLYNKKIAITSGKMKCIELICIDDVSLDFIYETK